MVEASPSRVVRFGAYEADLTTGELRREGAKVALQGKPFQMLALLVQHPGELVTREDLRSKLWPADTFVDFEHGLNTAVKKLRQALDDSAEEPRYVETLPRRGYRFVGPIIVEGGTAAESPQAPVAPMLEASSPADAVRGEARPRRWRLHAAWLAAVVAVGLVATRLGPADRETGPPPNRQPVIVLMDSPLPGRVYDARTFAAGGTNADDLTDALRDLPVVTKKENTSPMWHREAQVLQQNPDLIVSHLSCLFDQRVAPPRDPALEQFFNLSVDRLLSFFAYVASNNRRTHFLVYSRGWFESNGGTDKFVQDAAARFPVLRYRLHAWTVPGAREQVTFRDPETARLLREQVIAALPVR